MHIKKFGYFLAITGLLLIYGENEEKPIAPKMEPEAGQYIRYAGGLLNLRIEENNFRLYFLDSKKAILRPKLSEVDIRYESLSSNDLEAEGYVTLNKSSNGKCLTSERYLPAPYGDYRITLFLEPSKQEGESKVFQYPTSVEAK